MLLQDSGRASLLASRVPMPARAEPRPPAITQGHLVRRSSSARARAALAVDSLHAFRRILQSPAVQIFFRDFDVSGFRGRHLFVLADMEALPLARAQGSTPQKRRLPTACDSQDNVEFRF